MHGDRWALVSEHVRTHPVLECITHFLQLPIEDDFLDELEARARGGGTARMGDAAQQDQTGAAEGAGYGPAVVGRVPLEGIEEAPSNPVVSSVAGAQSWGACKAHRKALPSHALRLALCGPGRHVAQPSPPPCLVAGCSDVSFAGTPHWR